METDFEKKYIKYKKKYIDLKKKYVETKIKINDDIYLLYKNINYVKAKVIDIDDKIKIEIDITDAIKEYDNIKEKYVYVFKQNMNDTMYIDNRIIEYKMEDFYKTYPKDINGTLLHTDILVFSDDHYTYDKTSTYSMQHNGEIKKIKPILLNIDDIYPSRQKKSLDEARINKLYESKGNSVIPPIIVVSGEDEYEIINGNHRYYYSKDVGYTKIPAFVTYM